MVPVTVPLREDIPIEHLDRIINDPYCMEHDEEDVLEEIRNTYQHKEKRYTAKGGPAPDPEETYEDDHKPDRCCIANLKKIGRNIIPDYSEATVVHNYRFCKYWMLNMYDFLDDQATDRPVEEDDAEDDEDDAE